MGRRPVTPLRSPAHLFQTVAVTAALALAGCAGPGASPQPASTTLHLSEYEITTGQLSLGAGIYTFTAINDAAIRHAMVLTGNGVEGHTKDPTLAPVSQRASPSRSSRGPTSSSGPVDGHQGLGMQGTMVVR